MSLNFRIEKELPKLKENSFVEQMLEHNDIEYPELFMNPEEHIDKIYTDPFKLFGMREAVEMYLNGIKENNRFGILVDDDADGFSSAATFIKLHKKYSDEGIVPIFHDNKSHGFSGEVDKIINSKVDFLIVPDAGSNDFKEQIELLQKGIKIIILDHHEMDEQDKVINMYKEFSGRYALVNNQLIFNGDANKNLVGAGMVLKFAEALDTVEENNFADELYDIVAMGQIGDSSDLADYEIHYIVDKGLSNMKSNILKEVFSEQIEKGDKIAPINLSFLIIPFVNAVTRVGTLEEKEKLLMALSDEWHSEELVTVEKRRKNKITGKFNKVEEKWSPYAIAMDEMGKIKNRQNKEVDKILKIVSDSATVNKVCITTIDESLIEYRSITGLIANKLVSKYQMPALMLITSEDPENDNLSGSARGYEKTFKSFRQWCLDSGQFELAQGHDNAFGVVINKDKLSNLENELENKFKSTDDITYDVDKIYYNESNIDETIMINDNQNIFGGKVENPTFGYKDLVMSRNSLNQRGSVITFFHAGLEFIMYKQELGIADDFLMTLGFEQKFKADLVGRPSRNNWGGRIKEQIVLDDFSISKIDNVEETSESDNESRFIVDGELSF